MQSSAYRQWTGDPVLHAARPFCRCGAAVLPVRCGWSGLGGSGAAGRLAVQGSRGRAGTGRGRAMRRGREGHHDPDRGDAVRCHTVIGKL